MKLRHYLELSATLAGRIPADLGTWLRSPHDIPPGWEQEAAEAMTAPGWTPAPIPDPTLLAELIRPGTLAG